MHEKYRSLRYEAEVLQRKVSQVLENPPLGGFEEKIAQEQFERLLELLQDTVEEMEHYSKPVKTGTLRRIESRKFELVDRDRRSLRTFSCGSSIECYVEVEEEMTWAAGRVEHTRRGDREDYYFYCREAGHPFLEEGMKARIRVSE